MQSAPREKGISSFTCRVNCDVAVSGTALRAPNASECVKGPGERGLFFKFPCLCLILEVRVCMSACLGVCISTRTDMYIYVTTDQYTLINSIDVKKVQNDKEKIIR